MQCRSCTKGRRDGPLIYCERYRRYFPDPSGYFPTACPIYSQKNIQENPVTEIESLRASLKEIWIKRSNIRSEIDQLECQISDYESELETLNQEETEIHDEIHNIEVAYLTDKSEAGV